MQEKMLMKARNRDDTDGDQEEPPNYSPVISK